jgi:hypothetical protein
MKKSNGYTQVKAHARQQAKQRDADARQAIYDDLTLAQKIALVTSRGGSKRELARLTKVKEKPVPVVVQPARVPDIKPLTELEPKPKRTPKSKVTKTAKMERPSKS